MEPWKTFVPAQYAPRPVFDLASHNSGRIALDAMPGEATITGYRTEVNFFIYPRHFNCAFASILITVDIA